MDEAVMEIVERLGGVASALEVCLKGMEESQRVGFGDLGRVSATAVSEREEELERRLAEAETKVSQLRASAAGGRKTASAGRMAAKEAGEVTLAGALDGALQSLCVEQRIAVKSELMRAGVM